MSIDQNQKVVEIPAPQDAAIARLGVELNKTYLPYGRMGAGWAGATISAGRERGASRRRASWRADRSPRGTQFYCNDAWDLVDAIKNGKCKLEDLKTEDLPADLRKLDKAARKAKVEEAAQAARGDPGADPQAEQGA